MAQMKAFFHQLFDYNYHCNRKLLEACGGMDALPGKTGTLFSHILNAHHIWNTRMLGEPASFDVWQEHDCSAWEELHYENQRATFEIITNADSFESRVTYENSEGRSYSNSLMDILFHIVNHSTYHRGQIAIAFREAGLEPLPQDYILYKR